MVPGKKSRGSISDIIIFFGVVSIDSRELILYLSTIIIELVIHKWYSDTIFFTMKKKKNIFFEKKVQL